MFYTDVIKGPKGKVITGYVVKDTETNVVATYLSRKSGGGWRAALNAARRECDRLNRTSE